MILTVIRNERITRLLPGLALVSLLTALPLVRIVQRTNDAVTSFGEIAEAASAGPVSNEALLAIDKAERFSASYVMLVMGVIAPLVLACFLMPCRVRVREYERALPFTLRELVWGRIATCSIAVMGPLLVGIAVCAVLGGAGDAGAMVGVSVRAATAFALAVLLPFAWKPRAHELGQVEAMVLGVLALGIVFLPMSIGADWLVAANVAGVAALGLWIAVQVPREIPALGGVAALGGGGETHSARKPLDRGSLGQTAAAPRTEPLWRRFFSPLDWTLLRSTVMRPRSVICLLWVGFMVAVADGPEVLFLVWFPIIVVAMCASHGLAPLHGLGHLPIPRSKILHWATVPSLICLLLAFSLHSVAPWSYRSSETLARTVEVDRIWEELLDQDDSRGLHVKVPVELWSLGVGDVVPETRAPWGEGFRPNRHPLFWGSERFAYNPYDVGEQNSVRFLSWQVSRALRDFDGVDIQPDEVYERAFAGRDPVSGVAKHEPDQVVAKTALGARGAHRPWGALDSARDKAKAPYLGLGILTWLTGVLFVLRPNRPPATLRGWRLKRALASSAGLLLAALILVVTLISMQDNALLPVIFHAAFRAVDGALGSNPVAWAALDLSLLAGGYLLVRRRAARIEVPPLPTYGIGRKVLSIY